MIHLGLESEIDRGMNGIPTQHCTTCGEEFSLTKEHFYWLESRKCFCRKCIPCSRKRTQIYRDHVTAIPEGYKRCTICLSDFPATTEYFTRWQRAKDGLFYQCKECVNKKNRNHKSNKRLSNPIIQKYETIIAHQCSSCGTTKGNIIGDTDKITGEKHGLLCMKCYLLVRDFRGDPTRLRSTFDYLMRTQLSHV